MNQPLFGSAGSPDAFRAEGYKNTVDLPAWLADKGLGALEYACGRGVKVGETTAKQIGAAARAHNIALSLHAPYYINMASPDEVQQQKSIHYMIQAMTAADWMGGQRVVFHTGSVGKQEREPAMEQARATFGEVLEAREKLGLGHVLLCPETLGKKNQLGDVEEMLSLCALGDNVIPTIDFGHLHAVTGGGFTDPDEYRAVFQKVGEALGAEAQQRLHVHFSKIEYSAAGERRHGIFSDTHLGPPPEALVTVCAQEGYTPWIICESAGTQEQDAAYMRRLYLSAIDDR